MGNLSLKTILREAAEMNTTFFLHYLVMISPYEMHSVKEQMRLAWNCGTKGHFLGEPVISTVSLRSREHLPWKVHIIAN